MDDLRDQPAIDTEDEENLLPGAMLFETKLPENTGTVFENRYRRSLDSLDLETNTISRTTFDSVHPLAGVMKLEPIGAKIVYSENNYVYNKFKNQTNALKDSPKVQLHAHSNFEGHGDPWNDNFDTMFPYSVESLETDLDRLIKGKLNIDDVIRRQKIIRSKRSLKKKDTIDHVTEIMESIEDELHDLKVCITISRWLILGPATLSVLDRSYPGRRVNPDLLISAIR